MAKKQRRGFAAMSPEKQRAIAVAGGKAGQQRGAHRWTEDEARERARQGGLARAKKARERAAAPAPPAAATQASGSPELSGRPAIGSSGAAEADMPTEQRRRSGQMIASMVGADLEALQKRGVRTMDLPAAPFTGRDALRGVYEAALLLVLQLRTLIEEETVTRVSRSHPTEAGPALPVDASSASVAALMVHRNVGGRCQFCDEAFPCAFARGLVR